MVFLKSLTEAIPRIRRATTRVGFQDYRYGFATASSIPTMVPTVAPGFVNTSNPTAAPIFVNTSNPTLDQMRRLANSLHKLHEGESSENRQLDINSTKYIRC